MRTGLPTFVTLVACIAVTDAIRTCTSYTFNEYPSVATALNFAAFCPSSTNNNDYAVVGMRWGGDDELYYHIEGSFTQTVAAAYLRDGNQASFNAPVLIDLNVTIPVGTTTFIGCLGRIGDLGINNWYGQNLYACLSDYIRFGRTLMTFHNAAGTELARGVPVWSPQISGSEFTGDAAGTGSAGNGVGLAYTTDSGSTLAYAAVQSLTATGMHIHIGGPAVTNGNIAFPLTATTLNIGTASIDSSDQEGALPYDASYGVHPTGGVNQAPNAGYWNVHTTAYPNGEIRGQNLILDRLQEMSGGEPFNNAYDLIALMTASNVNYSGSTSSATQGFGLFIGTFCSNADLTFNFTYYMLVNPETGTVNNAHIHIGNATTTGGGIVQQLTFPTTADGMRYATGSFNVGQGTSALAQLLQNGSYYVNVHTVENPNGAIRGNIFRVAENIRIAWLNGAQTQVQISSGHWTPTSSQYDAIGVFILNATRKTLSYHDDYTTAAGLSSYYVVTNAPAEVMTVAHLHGVVTDADNNPNAPPIFALEKSIYGSQVYAGTMNMTDPALVSAWQNDCIFYFNIHTQLNPQGELRGDLYVPICNSNMVPCVSFIGPYGNGTIAEPLMTTGFSGPTATSSPPTSGPSTSSMPTSSTSTSSTSTLGPSTSTSGTSIQTAGQTNSTTTASTAASLSFSAAMVVGLLAATALLM